MLLGMRCSFEVDEGFFPIMSELLDNVLGSRTGLVCETLFN
jgi:hypothetical protein